MREKLCYISRPPIFLSRDESNRMHCTADYAIYFKDGFGLHYIHGVYFTPEDFEKFVKTKPTPRDIININNAEQRAVLFELYGIDYVLDELPNKKILASKRGDFNKNKNKPVEYELFEYDFSSNFRHRAIKVQWWESNRLRTTILGLPNEEQTETITGALAWTFGLDKKDYNLECET
jgi:hypothetical protein